MLGLQWLNCNLLSWQAAVELMEHELMEIAKWLLQLKY